MYSKKSRYENLQHGLFDSAGNYGTPKIEKCVLHSIPEIVSFNCAKSVEDKQRKGVHFFIDDYHFTRLWSHPLDYINTLSQFLLVFTPDFSMFTDFPKAIQIYNHYRKHWLGAYWQSLGLTVIPTICWSDESSFEWCFDGEPVGGTVAISSVGTQKNAAAKKAFIRGYEEMLCRLKPETVVFYGKVPDECSGNIIQVRTFQDKFKEE